MYHSRATSASFFHLCCCENTPCKMMKFRTLEDPEGHFVDCHQSPIAWVPEKYFIDAKHKHVVEGQAGGHVKIMLSFANFMCPTTWGARKCWLDFRQLWGFWTTRSKFRSEVKQFNAQKCQSYQRWSLGTRWRRGKWNRGRRCAILEGLFFFPVACRYAVSSLSHWLVTIALLKKGSVHRCAQPKARPEHIPAGVANPARLKEAREARSGSSGRAALMTWSSGGGQPFKATGCGSKMNLIGVHAGHPLHIFTAWHTNSGGETSHYQKWSGYGSNGKQLVLENDQKCGGQNCSWTLTPIHAIHISE